MQIPTDYASFFRGRLLIITGVGRSGTTILGKLIGSMKPTIYLFEPAIMKYWLPVRVFSAVLSEDYFLPRLQGRAPSLPADDSWIGNYWTDMRPLPRRNDALAWIEQEKPLFVIKTNEFATMLNDLKAVFPDYRSVHIYRNGLDVVTSAVARGWYTDEYCARMVDWCEQRDGVWAPWYIEKDARGQWAGWTPVTRAAHVWRKLMNDAAPRHHAMRIQYEDLLGRPDTIADEIAARFGLETTEITQRHIESIQKLRPQQRQRIKVEDIQEPEQAKFRQLMEELHYL